jgi:hypothetical protein
VDSKKKRKTFFYEVLKEFELLSIVWKSSAANPLDLNGGQLELCKESERMFSSQKSYMVQRRSLIYDANEAIHILVGRDQSNLNMTTPHTSCPKFEVQ